MAPKKWIDKKTADTYSVRHRSFNDPLYNDSDAPEHVLVKVGNLNDNRAKQERKTKWGPTTTSGQKRVQTGNDLEEQSSEFKSQGRRDNEGEAALYGITFDDSKYDYMQHLKPIGEDPRAVFVARKDLEKKKGLTGDIQLKDEIFPAEMLPSQETVKKTYQDQQNIPDEISGLQPDMDPRLREVLEALEDEEYVEGDGEDLFSELVKGGEADSDEYDEWDDFDPSEHVGEFNDNSDDEQIHDIPQVQPKEGEQEWETAFRQFKLEEKHKPKDDIDSDDGLASETGMTEMTTMSRATKGNSRRRRKMFKKGAMTELSGLSMSSSALFRNKGLTFLDDKFDKIEEEYEGEEEESYQQFDMKKERSDLESAMDDFLNNYVVEGKHMYKKK